MSAAARRLLLPAVWVAAAVACATTAPQRIPTESDPPPERPADDADHAPEAAPPAAVQPQSVLEPPPAREDVVPEPAWEVVAPPAALLRPIERDSLASFYRRMPAVVTLRVDGDPDTQRFARSYLMRHLVDVGVTHGGNGRSSAFREVTVTVAGVPIDSSHGFYARAAVSVGDTIVAHGARPADGTISTDGSAASGDAIEVSGPPVRSGVSRQDAWLNSLGTLAPELLRDALAEAERIAVERYLRHGFPLRVELVGMPSPEEMARVRGALTIAGDVMREGGRRNGSHEVWLQSRLDPESLDDLFSAVFAAAPIQLDYAPLQLAATLHYTGATE